MILKPDLNEGRSLGLSRTEKVKLAAGGAIIIIGEDCKTKLVVGMAAAIS